MLNDAEAEALNRRVAEAMGWTEWTEDGEPIGVWELPNGDPVQFDTGLGGLPDFCRDTHALGWLAEWLDKQPVEYVLSKGRLCGAYQCDFWSVEGYGSRYLFNRTGHTAGEAFVFAIIAYAESEKK